MASRTQDVIYESFKALTSGGSIASAVERTAGQVSALTAAATGNSPNTGNSVVSAVSKVFTSGLGLVPLVSGLLGLFGGGSEPPPPLVKYTMPEPIYFQGADIGSNILGADYDQTGMVRAYEPSPASGSAAGGSHVANTTPQISVNVQAMDARSFLDHSNEIAQAVRQAMLNLNSLNDVVSDL